MLSGDVKHDESDFMDRQSQVLELGVNAIDDEHRQVMMLFSKFTECVRIEASAEKAFAVLREALTFGNIHMQHEEELMAKAGYPAIEDHKIHHRAARLRYTTLMSDTYAIQALEPAIIEHLEEIQQLVRQHIDGPDRKLAEYLKSCGVR
jgi:hemerythrin-like metal-binding protein